MPSLKARQKMHGVLAQARAGAPLPAQRLAIPAHDPRMATIELEGSCQIAVGPLKLPAECESMRFYIGGWLTRDRCCLAPLAVGSETKVGIPMDPTRPSFALSLPVDLVGDVDTLKLQILCVRLDPDTGLTKAFPVLAGVSCMHKLAKEKQDTLKLTDPFNTPVVSLIELRLRGSVDTSRLRRSALYRVGEYNENIKKLSSSLVSAVTKSKVRVPQPVKPFLNGLSFLSNSGNQSIGIPPPNIHYATMDRNIAGLKRALPHTVLAYYLQMVVTQSGMTIDEVLALPPREFAKFAGDVLWGITSDAGAAPYQPDENLALGVVVDEASGFRLKVVPVVSEDVGEPFSVFTYLQQSFDKPPPIAVPEGRGTPKETHAAHVAALKENQSKLIELNRPITQDDCETTASAGQMAVNTVKNKDMSTAAFLSELSPSQQIGAPVGAEGTGIFRHWTQKCYVSTAHFYTRLQHMLMTDEVEIKLMVGLAGAASANDATEGTASSIDRSTDLCGHCFAVLRHRGDDGQPYVRLLEGTTNMRVYPDLPDGPEYTCKIARNGEPALVKLPMSKFLTMLCQTASEMIRVTNVSIDQRAAPGPRGAVPNGSIRGLTRPTIVSQCLHTQNKSSDMIFYQWCMFTGLASDPSESGSLPLDESEFPGALGAGCRPAALAKCQLKGIGVTEAGPGADILDEVWPPFADKGTFERLLSLWAAPAPLVTVNSDVGALRRAGVTYTAVSFFETPSSPQIVGLVYAIKSLYAKEINRIQRERPDSDGIFMTVHEIGTGVTCTLHVPEKSATHTFIDSTATALAALKSA